MMYDTNSDYVYAFEGKNMLAVSGTTIVSTTPTSYAVTSALYNAIYNNILAFY